MEALQSVIINLAKAVANERSVGVTIEGPLWSSDFRCYFYSVTFGSTGMIGAIFPADANFWNKKGLDIRFERVDFASDRDMLEAIQIELHNSLGRNTVDA